MKKQILLGAAVLSFAMTSFADCEELVAQTVRDYQGYNLKFKGTTVSDRTEHSYEFKRRERGDVQTCRFSVFRHVSPYGVGECVVGLGGGSRVSCRGKNSPKPKPGHVWWW